MSINTTHLAEQHAAAVVLSNAASCSNEAVANARNVLYQPDERGFVKFGLMSFAELGQQCQYASRYVYGIIPGYPNITEGLRFNFYEEGRSNYHSLLIHIDDIPEFIRRYRELR